MEPTNEASGTSGAQSAAGAEGSKSVQASAALRTFDLDGFVRAGRETRGVVSLGALARLRGVMPEDAPAQAAETPLRWLARGEMRIERPSARRATGARPTSRAAATQQEGDVRRLGSRNQPYLAMEIDGAAWLECQRCLQPFSWPVSLRVDYRVARDDEQADALAADDVDADVIVSSAAFDLLDLIDEEVVLSLPMVPKHAVCPAVHAAVVSGVDGALGVDDISDIERRIAEVEGDDPRPLPGEHRPQEAGDDVAAGPARDMPRAAAVSAGQGKSKAGVASAPRRTDNPFAGLAGWRGAGDAGKAAGKSRPGSQDSSGPSDAAAGTNGGGNNHGSHGSHGGHGGDAGDGGADGAGDGGGDGGSGGDGGE